MKIEDVKVDEILRKKADTQMEKACHTYLPLEEGARKRVTPEEMMNEEGQLPL